MYLSIHRKKVRHAAYIVIFPVLIMSVLSLLPGCFRSEPVTGPGGPEVSGDFPGDTGTDPEETGDSGPPVNLVLCPLSGDMVPEGTTDRRPLAIMIENAPAARPQSGLDKADVVYEILAEGAITRFLAIFLHGDTEEAGPVRSARPYYIERMFEYNAMYAYCGGSEAAKNMVRREGVASLDEFGVGRQAYWRIKGRKAPHNLYADTRKLRDVGAKRGYEKTVELPEFQFLAEGKENKEGITSGEVTVHYPRSFSTVRWEYDDKQKLYLRHQGGSEHRDAVTDKQLTGSNIIVQYTNTKVIDNEGRREIDMVGRGRAVLFTGGKAYTGTWAKKSMRAQTYFYGENGEELKLNPGQTWIEVVPARTTVDY
ncbi:MAG: DUF3048 domain-containing protein [Firmicutes bacterium HGW-Firmicutes-14]|nr:MAG: DUF3048 domain-containing protein [Firmicutes bacterium HGW-Firmicutes-14]